MIQLNHHKFLIFLSLSFLMSQSLLADDSKQNEITKKLNLEQAKNWGAKEEFQKPLLNPSDPALISQPLPKTKKNEAYGKSKKQITEQNLITKHLNLWQAGHWGEILTADEEAKIREKAKKEFESLQQNKDVSDRISSQRKGNTSAPIEPGRAIPADAGKADSTLVK